MPEYTLPDGRRVRPLPPDQLAERERRVRKTFSSNPLVPYEAWAREVDATCQQQKVALATPTDLTHRLTLSTVHGMDWQSCGEGVWCPTTETILRYQESFYRERYQDPSFTVNRSRLGLPRERLNDILASLARGEVDYPLVTALPRVLTEEEAKRTLHRVLLDRLIRAHRIAVWQRSDPNVNTFLEQVRDLTLGDLTLDTEGWRTRGLGGVDAHDTLLRFAHDPALRDDDPNQPWCRYLTTLYPTLPHPAATAGYTDLSFVAWERDPSASRVIEGARGPRGGTVTIQNRSQLDAVTYRYPLITPSRHLALFSQYHAATGAYLDTSTWSWTFGIIDPTKASDGPSVGVGWNADGLGLNRNHPGDVHSNGRLRSSR